MDQKRIILIDDEEVITFGFKRALKQPGLQIDTAGSAAEAMQLISKELYDAAIIDMKLSPEKPFEGLDVVAYLKTRTPLCRIIVLTAFGDDETRSKAVLAGADVFLEKPIEPDKLEALLHSLGAY